MNDLALELNCVGKNYRGFRLNDVSLSLPQGFVMGLIGPNGAGKTTIIKLIMNLIRRSHGEISIFGLDNICHEVEVKQRIGFVYDTPCFFDDVRLDRIKAVVAPFYSAWDNAQFNSLCDEFKLPLKHTFKTLSLGMKMKFSLALALSHNADLIVMDEPTAGLDPVFRRELLEKLYTIMQNENKSILFSSHITTDLERIADYITLIHNGAIVFSKSKEEVLGNWAIVRGNEELLASEHQSLFLALRQNSLAIVGLTQDRHAVHERFGSRVAIDPASLDDIMIMFADKRS